MYKILLTVDDTIARKNFQDQLELKMSGSEIIFTNNTHETTAFLAQNQVSLVVLDLHSFQVDGLNILALMTQEYPKTPCFILGDHTLLETGAQSALYHYVQKPYDLEEVTSNIAHVIRDDVLASTPKGIPVATFTQLISKEAKTCLIGIYPPDGNKGLFYFEKGILFDAVQSNLKGEEAAQKMLAIEAAQIRFKDIQKKIARKINTSLLALVEKIGAPGPQSWEKQPEQAKQPTADQPEAPEQHQQTPEPEPAPIAEPEPVAGPIDEVEEVEESLPEVELEPIEEEVITDEEPPLFAGPAEPELEETTEATGPQPIASEEEPTVTEEQEITEKPEAQEGPLVAQAIVEETSESITEEVNEEPPVTPTDKAETTPEEPERPKTRDYFEEATAQQESRETEAKAPAETVTKKTEEETPAGIVKEEAAPEGPERPKTIDYFEKVEVQKPQQEPAASAVEEATPDKPETMDYGVHATEEPESEAEDTATSPEEPLQHAEETGPADDTQANEEVAPIEDIVSVLEAEPDEVDEEFEEVAEETGADEEVETLEILEEEEEQQEAVVPENPEPELDILAEPAEVDAWEEPVETIEDEPVESISEISEESEEEEKVSNETMEEVVAPIETAIQGEAPQPDSEIETDPKTLWEHNIGDLRDIRGYKAAAMLNFNGEVAVFDSIDPNIQLNTIGATFNSLFWLSQDAFNRVGLKDFNELILSTPAGLVVMISSGKESPRQFHLIGILGEDGNQNLMRFKFGNLAQKLKNTPA